MRKICFLFITIMILSAMTVGCSNKEQEKGPAKEAELTVSAAASLKDALSDITADFNKKHPNIKIHYNFGGSGALQQQIAQGAPVDLFLSAAEDKFDQLVADGFIDKNNQIDLVGNEIVLVVPKDGDKGINGFKDLAKADKISIGTPEAVPAGKYAKETFDHLDLWKAIESKTVYAKDVRQVLTYVETGNVDAGVVYKTDAQGSQKVKIVETADKDSHGPIIYPAGIVKNSKQMEEAQLFYEYLQNEKSMATFEKFGFKGLKE
ncbi:molybdate ABC transporter substrate-binding protein [Bacillus sp. REN3]|uniref:molybdate ABC transporter substrate-binding protein n=1 Tax=Bacillus sp. REN3 TaxID=2802440 RepID=UPI001AEDB787|nr:molybdate ABC transporter substrate-binding protein [Bacillus sp. REN3]